MSYILDALRKADAERSRGAVPTLQTQPALADAGTSEAAARTAVNPWAAGGALAAVLLVLAAGAWWWLAPGAPAPAPAAVVRPPAEPVAVPSAAAPTPPAAPPPADVRIALPESPPVLPAPVPQDLRAVAPPVPVPAPTAPATAAERTPRLDQLPEALRRQVPALALGGSVYSDQPASRFLMVNGQLLREGDAVAPNLVLERIGQRSAVLRLRDQRFELPY